jgi:polyhydroxyalkanoate synthase subunit PhaC
MARPPDAQHSTNLDRQIIAMLSQWTGGLSPASLLLAFFDWGLHLSIHPSKQLALLERYQQDTIRALCQLQCFISADLPAKDECLQSTRQDKRFADPSWQQWPFFFFYQTFLRWQNFFHEASTDVRGVSHHHQTMVEFMLRQLLDMYSPGNFPLLNPEIIAACEREHGENFARGWLNFCDDYRRQINHQPPAGAEKFIVGDNMASCKGKVIYRNQLIELIQYSPKTKTVYANPILIIPAWIMKYYILDLTPSHSLVRYLVAQGHTVFMVSWKNPDSADRDLGMDDYLNLGVMSALAIVGQVIPQQKIHLVGYCLGGTLSAIAAASLARDNDQTLASLTLFAAQTDFTEPGELGLFIDDSQLSYLENIMWDKGYLDSNQMLGTFQLLRSNDLIWSRIIHDYLLGIRKPLTDVMAWNADATRLPYRMHTDYLHQLFLHNELAAGNYKVNGAPIALMDITIPLFVVATERDHVSPWQSVFKINLLTNTDITFCLTTGGHNVGIVSPPTSKIKRHYRLSTMKANHHYQDPERWHLETQTTEGSWWPAFEQWLCAYNESQLPAPTMGNPAAGIHVLGLAPGTYVLQK